MKKPRLPNWAGNFMATFTTRKILDSGASTSSELKTFLSLPSNAVILTQFWARETFRRKHKISDSFSILAKHPAQVIALKRDEDICALRPLAPGLHDSHVSEAETEGFRRYCGKLAAKAPEIAKSLWEKAQDSEGYIQSLTSSADGEMRQGMGPEHLSALRAKRTVAPELLQQIDVYVANMTAALCQQVAPNQALVSFDEIKYSYPFRMAVAICSLTLHWAADGDIAKAPAERIRNDITDATYTAHASFFDGLITEDKKLKDINVLNSLLLKDVFKVTKK